MTQQHGAPSGLILGSAVPSDPAGASITLSRVVKHFGRTTAVDGLSLDVPAGTTCGFIGLNGAGKTTAIRMMVGLLAPDDGLVRVAGCRLPEMRQDLKFKLGYVPDRPTVYGWMRVGEAIAFCRSLYGPRWKQARVDELTRVLRLDETKRVKHLSKGSAAKLQLLLAIGHDPEVLILDEPTSGFDPLARDEFLEGILDASNTSAEQDRRRTILFSSHALSDVQRLADSIALMHRGRLLFHQPVDQLLESNKRIRAVLSREITKPQLPSGAVWQKLNGREWLVTVKDFSPEHVAFVRATPGVEHVEVIDVTLDDLFRDYVRGADVQTGETL